MSSFAMGPAELLIVAAIGLTLIAVPLAILLAVFSRQNRPNPSPLCSACGQSTPPGGFCTHCGVKLGA